MPRRPTMHVADETRRATLSEAARRQLDAARGATPPPREDPREAIGRQMQRAASSLDDEPPTVEIADVLEAAARAASTIARNTDGGEGNAWVNIPISPTRACILNMASAIDTVPIARARGHVHGPAETLRAQTRAATDALRPPGQHRENLRALVHANSRLLALGARLIELPEAGFSQVGSLATPTPNPHAGRVDPPIILREEPGRFGVVDAASFAPVIEGADVAVSPLPSAWAEIDRDGLTQFGLRFTIARRDVRLRGVNVVAAELGQGIAAGLGRLADRVLLDALGAAGPLAAPTPSAVAGAGLDWGELRAVIGTGGTGAVTDDQACLYLGAVDGSWRLPATLTNQAAGSFAGAWNRIGLALHDRVELIAHRMNRTGDLQVVVWAFAGALLPDPAKFFEVTP